MPHNSAAILLALMARARLAVGASCLAVLLVMFAPAVLAQENARNILILLSNDPGLSANVEMLKGVRSALGPDGPAPAQIFDEYLDAARFPEAERAEAMRGFLKTKFAATHIDLVVAIGPEALRFMIGHRQELFAGVPVVFAGIREESLKSLVLPADMTGIISQIDPAKTLELALRLKPDTEQVVVVSGAAPFDKSWEAKARTLFAPFEAKHAFTYLSGLRMADLLDRVAKLPPNSQIVFLSFFEDGSGARLRPNAVVEKVALAANAPVYGIYDTYLDRGIVGGYMDTFEAVGRETGKLALAVLDGESPQSISPHEAETHRFIIDWRQIERWNLNADALPAGTEIRFKEKTAWERYRREIIAIAAVMLVQSAMLLLLASEVRRRKRAQRAAEEASERMDAAVTGADLGLWNWSADTDTVWTTQRCRKLLGLNADIPLRRDNFLSCLSPEDRALALERMASALRTGRICVSEYLIRLPGDGERWIMTKTIPKSRINGSAERLIGVILDITERKQREMEAERQRQELAHLSRVSVLGALSGALAHELNQPLTAILSNAEAASMLARRPGNAKEIQGILRDIIKDNKRAGQVIHHLRSLLRKEQAAKEHFAANEIVNDVLGLCHSDLVIKGVTVVKRLGKNLPMLLGDAVQLRQVLLNLILNSCDAMAERPAGERILTIATTTETDTVAFSISDNGRGVPAETIEDLFQPFYTTKSFGMGLGLPICQWIVAAHGGELSARNNPAGGATFSFELPSPGMGCEKAGTRFSRESRVNI